jgi:hypothetical protein
LNGLIRVVVAPRPGALTTRWHLHDDPAWQTVVFTGAGGAGPQIETAARVHHLHVDLTDPESLWDALSTLMRGFADGLVSWNEPAIDALWVEWPRGRRSQIGTALLVDNLRPWLAPHAELVIARAGRVQTTRLPAFTPSRPALVPTDR